MEEKQSALSARKIGCRAKNSCTKNAKKSNEPLLGFGTKNGFMYISREGEKHIKNKKQKR